MDATYRFDNAVQETEYSDAESIDSLDGDENETEVLQIGLSTLYSSPSSSNGSSSISRGSSSSEPKTPSSGQRRVMFDDSQTMPSEEMWQIYHTDHAESPFSRRLSQKSTPSSIYSERSSEKSSIIERTKNGPDSCDRLYNMPLSAVRQHRVEWHDSLDPDDPFYATDISSPKSVFQEKLQTLRAKDNDDTLSTVESTPQEFDHHDTTRPGPLNWRNRMLSSATDIRQLYPSNNMLARKTSLHRPAFNPFNPTTLSPKETYTPTPIPRISRKKRQPLLSIKTKSHSALMSPELHQPRKAPRMVPQMGLRKKTRVSDDYDYASSPSLPSHVETQAEDSASSSTFPEQKNSTVGGQTSQNETEFPVRNLKSWKKYVPFSKGNALYLWTKVKSGIVFPTTPKVLWFYISLFLNIGLVAWLLWNPLWTVVQATSRTLEGYGLIQNFIHERPTVIQNVYQEVWKPNSEDMTMIYSKNASQSITDTKILTYLRKIQERQEQHKIDIEKHLDQSALVIDDLTRQFNRLHSAYLSIIEAKKMDAQVLQLDRNVRMMQGSIARKNERLRVVTTTIRTPLVISTRTKFLRIMTSTLYVVPEGYERVGAAAHFSAVSRPTPTYADSITNVHISSFKSSENRVAIGAGSSGKLLAEMDNINRQKSRILDEVNYEADRKIKELFTKKFLSTSNEKVIESVKFLIDANKRSHDKAYRDIMKQLSSSRKYMEQAFKSLGSRQLAPSGSRYIPKFDDGSRFLDRASEWLFSSTSSSSEEARKNSAFLMALLCPGEDIILGKGTTLPEHFAACLERKRRVDTYINGRSSHTWIDSIWDMRITLFFTLGLLSTLYAPLFAERWKDFDKHTFKVANLPRLPVLSTKLMNLTTNALNVANKTVLWLFAKFKGIPVALKKCIVAPFKLFQNRNSRSLQEREHNVQTKNKRGRLPRFVRFIIQVFKKTVRFLIRLPIRTMNLIKTMVLAILKFLIILLARAIYWLKRAISAIKRARQYTVSLRREQEIKRVINTVTDHFISIARAGVRRIKSKFERKRQPDLVPPLSSSSLRDSKYKVSSIPASVDIPPPKPTSSLSTSIATKTDDQLLQEVDDAELSEADQLWIHEQTKTPFKSRLSPQTDDELIITEVTETKITSTKKPKKSKKKRTKYPGTLFAELGGDQIPESSDEEDVGDNDGDKTPTGTTYRSFEGDSVDFTEKFTHHEPGYNTVSDDDDHGERNSLDSNDSEILRRS